jgi:dolichol-phosphate mannosyltransferase
MPAHPLDHETIILIPSLEPTEKLIHYVDELKEYGFYRIVVVDDGSPEPYRLIFERLREQGCAVIHHAENMGKGAALKSGMHYIRANYPSYSCVVTVDSDGQHAAEDVYQVARVAKRQAGALVLGIRDFRQPHVPIKSWIGNRISSAVFALLYGRYLQDTQTGLRAFGPQVLPLMLQVPGDRFEYELQVLIACIRSGIPIVTLPIRVIYENGNAGTHFKPIRDSLSIMKVMLSHSVRFWDRRSRT